MNTPIEFPPPSIYPFGVRIDEPIASITDLILSLVCIWAYVRMKKQGLTTWSQIHLRRYFLMVAIATALGGLLGHAFLYAFGFAWKLPGWLVGIVSVSLIERSSISHAQPLIWKSVGRFLLVFNIVEMVAILIITILTLEFKWVEYHNAYGLIVNVAGLHGYAFYRTRDRGSLIMLAGVGVTAVASVIFSQRISFHTWFNYIDASHLLLAVAAYVMYRGGIQLGTGGKRQSTY